MEQNVNRTANHCTGRIPLEGLPNTRDLGGIRTMEGKKILPARLIRSGALYEATPADLERLMGEWRLGTVVDFRTAVERSQKPDPDMDGVTNIFNPILNEETVGITFEDEEEGKPKQDAILGMLEHASSLGGDPELYVDKLYENLVVDEHASSYYGRFFDILLEADDRAVLWHCTAGKDRVGVGTALLLSALSVDRDTIIRDFVRTNEFVMENAEKTAALVREKTEDARLAECVKVLLTVSENYIRHAFSAMEAACGSVEAYLYERIGLNERKRAELKRKFLL
ncbi:MULTISPECIES: tyrosine-protein phosphatase [Hungatella]|uniref:tyrosine-protein phosphatase n=1 Tax=Hungatella TaxID=1649459 RepID=UPI00258F23F8|nr:MULTISPECIES: tyrosine-protein phosphatase [Hungatella]MCI6454879.1 tyrosine-protein phosphatase [Hungatella sp.]